MPDARVISIPIPIESATTHFNIQYSEDRINWTTLSAAGVTDLLISALTNRKYDLDGVNTTSSTTENRPVASTPPMYYRYRLKATTTYGSWSSAFLIPSADDFLRFVKRRLKDPSLADETNNTALLTDTDYLDCIGNAVKAFELVHPRQVQQSFSMTSSEQDYNLPDLWSYQFSQVIEVEYPVQSTDPRSVIHKEYVSVDESQGKWRFRQVFPGTGETTRLFYTTRHELDGSTVPAQWFDSVGMWAAGDAAEQIQAHKNQFGDLQIGAEYISIDPRIQKWGEIGRNLKRQAHEQWGSTGSGVRAYMPLYEDHGRIPYSVLNPH
jgi:hypothetical protein